MEGGLAPRAPPTLSTSLMEGEYHPPPCAASWHAGGIHPGCLGSARELGLGIARPGPRWPACRSEL
eukprot:scaffold233718_cov21-Tisochrysis_lutea.AAC.1